MLKKRYIPLALLLLFMVLAYASGLSDSLTYESLKNHRESLLDFVSKYPVLSPLIFMSIYALSTALSIPGGIVLSIFGGFLFPQPWSTLYVVIAATTGAVLIFLAAKTALRDLLKRQVKGRLQKMQKGFEEDAAYYLLFLRLVPLFPFWLVNLAPAFFGVRLFTFAWTTFLGIIPGAFVFTQAGTGLGAILDAGNTLSIDNIFNIQIQIALGALGLFVLLPAIVKKIRK